MISRLDMKNSFKIVLYTLLASGSLAVFVSLTAFDYVSFYWRPLITDTTEAVGQNIFSLPEEAISSSVSIVAIGDMMLGRNVEGMMEKEGFDYPWRSVTSIFETADYVVANLEGPILKEHTRTPTGSTSFNFLPQVGEELETSGIDAVSLANNHTLDRGQGGYDETRQYLLTANIASFGHQKLVAEDVSILRTHVGEQSLAFIGLNDVFGILKKDEAIALIKNVATDENFVIVCIHWGDEYQPVHNTRQESLAHDFIDAGADLIIGHHPHVVQDVAVYKDRAIFYSLGNFIFDQYFSKETQEGLMVKVLINSDIVKYALIPVSITKSQPVPMETEGSRLFLADLANRSDTALSDNISGGMMSLPYLEKSLREL